MRVELFALCFFAGTAAAYGMPLHERLAEIKEVARISPQRALRQLDQLQVEAEHGTEAEQAEFFIVSSNAQHGLGRHGDAVALAEKAIAIGRRTGNNDVIAMALLSKAYAVFSLGQTSQSHELVWEAEKLAVITKDARLRVNTLISSGDSFAEDGSFSTALNKLQSATTLARQSGDLMLMVISLRSLAILYDRMREYTKGFEVLDEAMMAAEKINSAGRMALLKSTEYALAMDSNQIQRALNAELSALQLQRKLEAGPLIGISLVNLADCYLKLHDYRNALSYAQQGLEQANALNDQGLAATAYMNIGQAYLGMGNTAEGKKNMRAGMIWYEKSGKKPDLQLALGEYGDALATVGDFSEAVMAYHRERALLNELFEKRRQKEMMELQGKYEADSRQHQIELLRQENRIKSTEIDNRRLQQRIWWLLLVIFSLATLVVGILYNKVRNMNAQLKITNRELKQQSSRDPLTALYNRRYFQEFMRGREDSARMHPEIAKENAGAIFLLDVDHFKHINDQYGHGAGDAVLCGIGNALRNILRETDMIVRWGGEEFLAFLPSVQQSTLEEVAHRLLIGIDENIIHYQGHILSVQVSIGFAPFPVAPVDLELPWERVVNIVDMAMYLAKGHGRNRAYGVRGFGRMDSASMDEVERDIEQAWRDGQVDLSIVLGNEKFEHIEDPA